MLHICHEANIADKYEYKRIFNETNYRTFENLLENETWLSVYEALSVDTKYNNFITKFSNYFNIAFPLKKYKVQARNKKRITERNQKCQRKVKSSSRVMSAKTNTQTNIHRV